MSVNANLSNRILMVGPSLNANGGLPAVENQLMESFTNAGVSVDFISTYEGANKIKMPFNAMKAYIQFAKRIDGFDIVHIHMATRGSFERKKHFVRLANKRRKAIVIHFHSGKIKKWFQSVSSRKQNEIRDVFSLASKVVLVSNEWLSFFEENICCADKLTVLRNGVDIPDICSNPLESEQILFLGRLDDNKSPDVLIEAFAKVCERHPSANVVICGDGPRNKYEQIAKQFGVFEKCSFPGWVNGQQKQDILRNTGVFCLPSKSEGMPISILEAMAYGVPVVATSVGGIPELITDGENGFLVNVDDVEEIASKLDALLSRPSLRGEMGMAGRMKAIEECDASKLYLKYQDLYSKILVDMEKL